MEDFLKDIGIAGFFFFLIKGILWLVLFALVYFGLVDKKKVQEFRNKITFWKKKEK